MWESGEKIKSMLCFIRSGLDKNEDSNAHEMMDESNLDQIAMY